MKLKNSSEEQCRNQNESKARRCINGLKNLNAVDLLSVQEMQSAKGAKGGKRGGSFNCYTCMAGQQHKGSH